MSPLTTSALPLLPLEAGVVLPGMTITLALETPEARAAVDAAAGAGGQLVLVPRRPVVDGPDGEPGPLAQVGTVATVERTGELPGGTRAVVVHGVHRVTVGGVTSVAGGAQWAVTETIDPPAVTEDG